MPSMPMLLRLYILYWGEGAFHSCLNLTTSHWSLFSTQHLDDLPLRILHFRLRFAKYKYVPQHVVGKLLYAVDALSRVPDSYKKLKPTLNILQFCHYLLHRPSLKVSKKHKSKMQYVPVRGYCRSSWLKRDALKAHSNHIVMYTNHLTSATTCCATIA